MCRWRWSASHGNKWMFIKSGRHRRLASMVRHVWPILRTCRRCSGVAAALARASCRRVGIPLRAALAPAPRRALPPDTPGRRDGLGSRGGNPNRLAPAPAALPRTRSLRPQALCRLPVTTVRRAWGPAPGGQRPPGAAGRTPGGAPPNNAVVARVRSRQILLLHLLQAARRHRRAVRCAASAGRPSDGLRRVGPPPGIANRTPPGGAPAPGTAAPNAATPNAVGPAPRQQPPVGAGRPPGGGPSLGIANRTPPAGPPSQSAAPPARPQGPPAQANRPPPQASPPPRPQGPPAQVNRPAATAGARRDRPADPAGSTRCMARAAAGCRGCAKAACIATAETCSSGACQATGLSARKVVRQRRLLLNKKAAPERSGAALHFIR